MLGELLYCSKVSTYGSLRVITALEFLQHHFSQMGHRKYLLVTHNLSQSLGQNRSVHLTRSGRRASGLVLVAYPYKCLSLARNASALSEARFHESVKLGAVLCARSIEPLNQAARGCGGCGTTYAN